MGSKEPSAPLQETSTLVFFGNEIAQDEVGDAFRQLQQHRKDPRCRHLAQFLDLCNVAIKEEVSRLPRSTQRHVPDYIIHPVLSRDTAFSEGILSTAMSGTLLVIYQIGMLIRQATSRHNLS
jgi:hypothetical protein